MSPDITHEKLVEYFRYDPEIGLFYSAKYRIGIRGVGEAVGSMQKNGYLGISFMRKLYYGHRLAWLWVNKSWPDGWIDHINGVKTDNRIRNLRLATPQQNTAWRKLNKNNTSGYRGVVFFKPAQLWAARIKVDRKDISLGYFQSPIDAAIKYDEAAVRYFGEFAKTNKQMGLL